jgi:putative ABC transport system substrate-binding protein
MPVIRFLHGGVSSTQTYYVAQFRNALSDAGYDEGRNVVIHYHWAEGRLNRLPELAADLVRLGASVIVAAGAPLAALEAKAATSMIPIVFVLGTDPVKLGLVASLNRPGGNMTGINFITDELGSKRVDLLHKLVPGATKIAYLSGNFRFNEERDDILAAAQVLGQQIIIVDATRYSTFEAAFAAVLPNGIDALIVGVAPMLPITEIRLWRWQPATRFQLYILMLCTPSGGA